MKTFVRSFVQSTMKSSRNTPSLKGNIDNWCTERLDVAGWANKRTDGHPEIALFINGDFKASIFAQIDREDLLTLPFPAKGFSSSLIPHLQKGMNEIELRFSDNGQTLPNGSKSIYVTQSLNDTVDDNDYLVHDIPMSKLVSHQNWRDHLANIGNKPGFRILEIGSREVCRASDARKRFSQAEYIGFDFYPGDNVDVVGDAHRLSSYFDDDEQFDLIYSSACFEHFAMPWVVATEIAKLLKVDGYIFVETHFSFGSHERPWHFFHFTDMALKALFCPALGFECLEAGVCNPIVGRFSTLADEHLQNRPVPGLYCHVEYLGKKAKNVKNFSWEQLNLSDVAGVTKYPQPKTS